MNIEEYLDSLDSLFDESWSVPLSGGKVVVDTAKAREIIEDIRLHMPNEIRQAKAIVADRASIITTAKNEADHIIHTAEERAAAMIKQEEIYKQATARATEISEQAQTKSREMRRAATEFAETVLKNSEEAVAAALNEIKQARTALRVPKNQ